MGKLVLMASAVFLMTSMWGYTFSGGSGAEHDPYRIASASDWQILIDTPTEPNAFFALTADIDFDGATIDPVGSPDAPFAGTLLGRGHLLKNFSIPQTNSPATGLFGVIAETGQVVNLGIFDFTVTGGDHTGGLCGHNAGLIAGCFADGYAAGTAAAGVLCGYNAGTIRDSYALGTAEGDVQVGGLIGHNAQGKVMHCYAAAVVSGSSDVGGLVGSAVTGGLYDDTGNVWDADVSGLPASAMGQPQSTETMTSQLTFINAGWELLSLLNANDAAVWRMCADGVDYPRLRWAFSKHGDLTCPDGVGIEDFAYLASRWLWEECQAANHCHWADINYDDRVDLGDFVHLSQFWLKHHTHQVPDITWVAISDSGEGMRDANGDPIDEGGFEGQMSRYLTTNAQFAHFLNDATDSGDIVVEGNAVYGAADGILGEDFSGVMFYQLDGPGRTTVGAVDGGASRIRYVDGIFTVDKGLEQHPVTYVSWYGAAAFACYYGWRLPSEWEWQAVADFDGTYIYACGSEINANIANYRNSNTNPHGTTPVGAFGLFGYGLADMAGNVFELTNPVYTVEAFNYNRLRGGGWENLASQCTVWRRDYILALDATDERTGFRVCR